MLAIVSGKTYPFAERVHSLAGGAYHSLAVTESGTLHSWGTMKEYGMLGLSEDHEDVDEPVRVHTVPQMRFQQVSCGGTYSAAIDEHGRLYTWGTAVYGQHGNPDPVYQVPRPVSGLGSTVFRVSCGRYHIAVVTDTGVVTWGYNCYGQLGHSNIGDRCSEPRPVDCADMPPAFDVSCGWNHTAIVCSNGSVYTCGKGKFGVLGLGDEKTSSRPVLVKSLSGVCQVACGGCFTLALTTEGRVYVCGDGEQGQLGMGPTRTAAITRFAAIPMLVPQRIISISAGESHAAAVDARGCVWLWGNNMKSQVCPDSERKYLFTPYCLPHTGQHIQQAVCGHMHTLLYVADRGLDFCHTPAWQLSNALVMSQYREQQKLLAEACKYAGTVAMEAKVVQSECVALKAENSLLQLRNTQLTSECRTMHGQVQLLTTNLQTQTMRAAYLDTKLSRLMLGLPPLSPFNSDAAIRTSTDLTLITPTVPEVFTWRRAFHRIALALSDMLRLRRRRTGATTRKDEPFVTENTNRILLLGYRRHRTLGLRDAMWGKRLDAAVAASSGWVLHRSTVSSFGLI